MCAIRVSKALKYGTCHREITQFYLLSTYGKSHPAAFTPQPQSIAAL